MKKYFLNNKLFWTSELIALVIVLGFGALIWAVDKTISVAFICCVQTPVLFSVVTSINWAWTWARRRDEFYW